MRSVIILIVLAIVFIGCNDETISNPDNVRMSYGLTKPSGQLPATEVLFDYGGSSENYIIPGDSTGWISYTPGSGPYELKFELFRDILVGTGGSGTYNQVRIIVKDKFNSTLLDTWYTQTWPCRWYVHVPTFGSGIGSHRVMIMVPNNYVDALGAKITLYRNSTH